MASTITLTNCTVELQLPSVLGVLGTGGPMGQHKIKLTTDEYIPDLLVKMPDGKVVTIKKLRLRHITGNIVPVVDDFGRVALFDIHDVRPDMVVVDTTETTSDEYGPK